MKKPRTTHRGSARDITMQEFAKEWFELLARPQVAKACKEIADEEGVSFEFLMCESLVDVYHKHGKPLPPDIRDYIMNHPDIPDAKRAGLLKADLR
jgi:CO dehydrogenase/acetyl-CoA synthase alpha subunit